MTPGVEHVLQKMLQVSLFPECTMGHTHSGKQSVSHRRAPPEIMAGFHETASLTPVDGTMDKSTKQVQWFCIFKDPSMGELQLEPSLTPLDL